MLLASALHYVILSGASMSERSRRTPKGSAKPIFPEMP